MTPDALATRARAFMEAAAKAAAATRRGDLPAAHHLFEELQRSNAILLRLIEKLTEDALVGGRIDRRPVRQLLGKKLICSSIAPRAEPIARWRHFLSL